MVVNVMKCIESIMRKWVEPANEKYYTKNAQVKYKYTKMNMLSSSCAEFSPLF